MVFIIKKIINTTNEGMNDNFDSAVMKLNQE